MAEAQPDRDELAFRENIETIRTSAKWLVAAFAALGTVLIAGSQLSSIGALSTTDGRLWAAVAGMAIALMAVLAMVWRTVRLLLPHHITVDDLARMEQAPQRSDAIKWFNKNRSYMPYDSFAQLQTMWHLVADKNAEEKPDLEKLDRATRKVQRHADLATATGEFRRVVWEVALAAIIAAVGIGVFAWAANPPATANPQNSLRNVQLTGLDLKGVNLSGADLVGADFTDTDLEGAVLRGAALSNVTWKNTICPDGTSSDDHAARGGDEAEGTCEGHLAP